MIRACVTCSRCGAGYACQPGEGCRAPNNIPPIIGYTGDGKPIYKYPLNRPGNLPL